ncbi:nucleotide disphospho-sugar-binding domain-containing protein [Nonomuraea angiospora]|uniref:nucleotide disphospho-sugar-binding domain-containing protein n=1 Tax=Nonomuraea angiospora TaxID=46172 RepID=UPI00343C9BA0
MRVLLVSYPEKTHFLAMAPLAWALRTAGHEAVFAGQPRFAQVINQAGLTAVPIGRDSDQARMMELDRNVAASGRTGLPEPYDVAEAPERATWEYLSAAYRQATTWWHKMENLPLIPDLVEFARGWRPDLVVWEPTTFAGAIAARACGAAHARLLFGPDVYGVTRAHFLRLKGEHGKDPLAEWLGSYVHFGEDLVTGHFTIDQLPPSLTLRADGLRYVPLRFTPYGGPSVVPGWLQAPPGKPRIALTLGLVATERFDGYTLDPQDVLTALDGLDVELVATLPEHEQRKLTHIPANTRLVPYVPLQALAPTLAAVIHHAGFGTLATTAQHSIPQLVVPGDTDSPAIARRLARQGSAITLPHPTPAAIRERLQRLLTDPAYAERAGSLAAEIHAAPTPNDLIPHLEDLTAHYRAQ